LLLALACATRAIAAPPTSLPSPAAGSRADGAIRLFTARIKAEPEDPYNYQKLGEAYVAKARESGDTSYYDRAAKLLEKALELAPDDEGSLVALAAVDLARHDFEASVAHARRAVEISPRGPGGHAALGDALLNRGDYEEAERAYGTLQELRPGLDTEARLAQMRELNGDPRGAAALLERALEEARRRPVETATIAFLERTLGEVYLASGQHERAKPHYEAALASPGGRPSALFGLARIASCRGDARDAHELAKRAVEALPLPVFLAFLGDLEAKKGDEAAARRWYALVEKIGLLGPAFGRELALFYADHGKPEQAVRLARRELLLRRDVATWDVLAWALHKAGRSPEAFEAVGEALRLGTRDARFLYHAGMIDLACGERARGLELLRQALEVNPCFDVLQADEARRLVEAGNHSPSKGSLPISSTILSSRYWLGPKTNRISPFSQTTSRIWTESSGGSTVPRFTTTTRSSG
jgi:tetratricopeptide (TPR) repeat protein